MSVVPPITKAKLGRTGLAVTNICFGTSGIGDMPETYGYSVHEERGKSTIRAILAGPVNFLDTSRIYGMGRSEQRIGDVIRELSGLPKEFVISTKLDRDVTTNRFDAAQARRSLEESLKALGLDRVHLLHFHDPERCASLSEATHRDGPIAQLFKMKEEGLAQSVGLAAGDIDVMMPLMNDWPFDAVITHNRFSLVNRNAEPMIEFSVAKGIAVLNAAPFGGGLLAKGAQFGRYAYSQASDQTLAPVRQIEASCVRHGIPLGAAALQFSLRDKRIASTICGVTKPERIQQTLDWAAWPISDDAWQELLKVSAITANPEA